VKVIAARAIAQSWQESPTSMSFSSHSGRRTDSAGRGASKSKE